MPDNVIEFRLQAVDQFQGVLRNLIGGFGAVGKAALALGAAGTAVAASMVTVARQAAEAQEQVKRFADRIGATTEGLSALNFAAEQSGVQANQMNMAVQRMTRRLSEASVGTGEAVSALRELKINVQEVSQLPADQQFLKMAEALDGVTNQSDRLRLAFKLFDSEGTAVLQTLDGGIEGLRAMARDAEFLGVVMSRQATENAAKFNSELGRIGKAIQGVTIAVGNEWIPIMTGFAHSVANAIAEMRDDIARWANDFLTAVLTIFVAGKQVFTAIKNFIVDSFSSAEGFDRFVDLAKRAFMWVFDIAAKALESLSVLMFGAFKLIWTSFFELAKWAWQKVFDFFTGNDLADTLGEVLFKRIPEATKGIREELGQVFDGIKSDWGELGERGAQILSDAFGVSVESIRAGVDEIRRNFTMSADAAEETEKKVTQMTLEQHRARIESAIEERNKRLDEWIQFSTSLEETFMFTMDRIFTNALTLSQELSNMMLQTWQQVTAGVGDAVAQAIVSGEDLMDSMKNLLNQVLTQIIATLVRVGIQRLIMQQIFGAASAREAAAELSKGLSAVYTNSFASAAAIPLVGWAIAPGVAAANLAIATAGATGAIAAGAGLGATVGIAHGGLDFVPREGTFLLDRGERVLSPGQNEDLTSFLNEGGGGGVQIGSLTIQIQVPDSQALRDMSESDWREVVAARIIPALDALHDRGVQQKALERRAR